MGDDPQSFEMRYEDENIWLTQKMLATLYDVEIPTINYHIKKIFDDLELVPEATIRKFLIVQTEGNRQVSRDVEHYNLQIIIAVGFKVSNERAVQFRKWANQIVKEYTIKGFAMDDGENNMSILSIASNASAWRGYEYYEGKRVLSWKQTSEHEFEGEVAGSEKEPYHVMIDTEHPKRSTCNCPHAEGKKIICKHKIALFFTVFPKEADGYIAEIEEYEREEEEREQERYDQIVRYVKSLSKEELRIELIDALVEAEERDSYRY